ncbi:MAG: peptide/nickel transport system permease protein/oligopeptide transport system permease protein [Verrucomicrobiales bacterium]|nr:peptide/nickel transport system permease protein/oligopeptide transport system permease protein [Verrucomicrobiales bacterium]
MSSAALSISAPGRAAAEPLTGWERLKLDRVAMVSLFILVLSAVICFLLPPLMDAARNTPSAFTYSPPGTQVTGTDGNVIYNAWLGTDARGRDVFFRVLSGGRVSLVVGLCAAAVSLFIGTLVGMTAGFYGGKIDGFLMRIVDVLYANPRVLFVLILISALTGPLNIWITDARNWAEAHNYMSLKTWVDGTIPYKRTIILIFCLGFIEWLTMARIVRGQVLVLKEQQFIAAARVLGQSQWKIMIRHLLPNLWTVILTYLTLTVPVVVLDESFLSFLGLGIEEPASSWGTLLKEGASALNPLVSRWWLLVSPAAAMGITLLALNFLGDALRDAFDVR